MDAGSRLEDDPGSARGDRRKYHGAIGERDDPGVTWDFSAVNVRTQFSTDSERAAVPFVNEAVSVGMRGALGL
jgi:hypothetical protein